MTNQIIEYVNCLTISFIFSTYFDIPPIFYFLETKDKWLSLRKRLPTPKGLHWTTLINPLITCMKYLLRSDVKSFKVKFKINFIQNEKILLIFWILYNHDIYLN